MLWQLAWKSLWSRRISLGLSILSITISVSLIVGVDHLRREGKSSFSKTVSGTDLIVGARSSQINLLLYSVFHIGNATNNISWQSYQEIAADRNVAWTIPISLGDSHKGFRVMGTTADFFNYYRFGQKQTLDFAEGRAFQGVYEAVLGAEVARRLHYSLGENIVIAHGLGAVSFSQHDDKPFVVAGILKPTGTPVDRAVHVSLAAIEAIHLGWQSGTKLPGQSFTAEQALEQDLTPETITAFMLGLKNRIATFRLQRTINEFDKEPMLAILPGVALAELWQTIGMIEKLLLLIAAFVVLAGLLGMLTTLLASLNERRREMAILRAIGARPLHIFLLLLLETLVLTMTGCIAGVALLFLALVIAGPLLVSQFGLYVSVIPLSIEMAIILGTVMLAATLLGTIPAMIAYRQTLRDGLSLKT